MKGGVGCSMSCRCIGCKNTFGRKDGDCLSGAFYILSGFIFSSPRDEVLFQAKLDLFRIFSLALEIFYFSSSFTPKQTRC